MKFDIHVKNIKNMKFNRSTFKFHIQKRYV